MSRTEDLRAALLQETGRRQLAEVRLADSQQQLAKAHRTIRELTELAASKPGLREVGVIAQAALLESFGTADEPARNDAAPVTAAR